MNLAPASAGGENDDFVVDADLEVEVMVTLACTNTGVKNQVEAICSPSSSGKDFPPWKMKIIVMLSWLDSTPLGLGDEHLCQEALPI